MRKKRTVIIILFIFFLFVSIEFTRIFSQTTGKSNLPQDSELVREVEEARKRPYFQDNTYYSHNEEITIVSYEYLTNIGNNQPMLIILLRKKNVGDEPSLVHVAPSFTFSQNERELDRTIRPTIPEEMIEDYPEFILAHNKFNQEVYPGEEIEFLLPIILEDTSEVKMEPYVRSIPSDDSHIYFFHHNTY